MIDNGIEEQAAVDTIRKTRGEPRIHKLRYAFGELYSNSQLLQITEKLSFDFSKRVMDHYENICVKDCNEILFDLLARLRNRKIRLTCFSASPENELIEVLNRLGIIPFFDDIGGMPKEKQALLNSYLSNNNLDPLQSIYVGDTLRDLAIAESLNVNFVGCNIFEKGPKWPRNVNSIKSWREFEPIVLSGIF